MTERELVTVSSVAAPGPRKRPGSRGCASSTGCSSMGAHGVAGDGNALTYVLGRQGLHTEERTTAASEPAGLRTDTTPNAQYEAVLPSVP